MTVLRICKRHTAKFALDFGRYGIHAHIINPNLHIPLIPFLVGLIEGVN